jgi:hypothetical protein
VGPGAFTLCGEPRSIALLIGHASILEQFGFDNPLRGCHNELHNPL